MEFVVCRLVFGVWKRGCGVCVYGVGRTEGRRRGYFSTEEIGGELRKVITTFMLQVLSLVLRLRRVLVTDGLTIWVHHPHCSVLPMLYFYGVNLGSKLSTSLVP